MSRSKSETMAQSNDLFAYLETLPKQNLHSIYEDKRGEWAAKTTLQKLPELARQFVIRLSVCGGSFPYEHVASWSSSRSKRDVQAALMRMEALGVTVPMKKQDQDEFGNGNGDEGGDGDGDGDGNGKGNGNTLNASRVTLTKQYYAAIQASLTSLSPSPYNAITLTEYELLCAKEKLGCHQI